jgi:hypothetical protein
MSVSLQRDGRSLVTDSREAISPGAGCTPVSGGVLCSGANRIFVGLGDGNDTLTKHRQPSPGVISAATATTCWRRAPAPARPR